MLKPFFLKLLLLSTVFSLNACGGDNSTPEAQANAIVNQMDLREKIGQKIMMSFRYWCPESDPNCTIGMTQYNETVGTAIAKNKIGGLILFADNLTDIDQTAELIWQLKRATLNSGRLGLFVSIDQEGGRVGRLPREIASNFSSNMALGAAYQATKNARLAYQEGQVLAAEIGSVGFNVNFAPVVDVNSNPLNPVISARAYGDDPQDVGLLGGNAAQGMASQQMIAAFKHFPGHGDTATDSHYGLPIVNKSREAAYAIDLAPYRTAIQNGHAPDMIMTAHIQYPALDSSTIMTSKTHEAMIVPATLSRKIQHDILRDELGYQGITVTDALNMKGIADFFEPSDAVIKTFRAGVDIALMPIEFRTASAASRLSNLIDKIETAVKEGELDQEEIDASVKRIVLLKLRRGITHDNSKDLDTIKREAHATIGQAAHKAIETDICSRSITVIKNDRNTLPLSLSHQKVHIITPWQEQVEAMRRRFSELGFTASGAAMTDTTWDAQKKAIDQADVIVVATLSTAPIPVQKNAPPADPSMVAVDVENRAQTMMRPIKGSLVFNADEDDILRAMLISDSQFARSAMEYAKREGKQVIHVTLWAPYDSVNYDDIADASIATYSYDGYLRGPALPVAVDLMLGRIPAVGKLPVNIRLQNPDGSLGAVKYPRGFGLSY